ncbi:hypothetical protein C2G38_2257116 [Gigaspora rosea]|uniref:Uncharacterized protein n=1 Tax=Gigaspora rosea TaxID=44941 RepID=A0A397WD15_9GLOM|nr:hypothetical protein C2G38_2257116 [Gigaspora rosea]
MGNANDENGLNKTPKNINDKNALLCKKWTTKKKKTPKNTTYEQATELGDNKPIFSEKETPYLTIPNTNQRKKTNSEKRQTGDTNDARRQPAKDKKTLKLKTNFNNSDENALSVKEMGNANDKNGLNKISKNINDKKCATGPRNRQQKKKTPNIILTNKSD